MPHPQISGCGEIEMQLLCLSPLHWLKLTAVETNSQKSPQWSCKTTNTGDSLDLGADRQSGDSQASLFSVSRDHTVENNGKTGYRFNNLMQSFHMDQLISNSSFLPLHLAVETIKERYENCHYNNTVVMCCWSISQFTTSFSWLIQCPCVNFNVVHRIMWDSHFTFSK